MTPLFCTAIFVNVFHLALFLQKWKTSFNGLQAYTIGSILPMAERATTMDCGGSWSTTWYWSQEETAALMPIYVLL